MYELSKESRCIRNTRRDLQLPMPPVPGPRGATVSFFERAKVVWCLFSFRDVWCIRVTSWLVTLVSLTVVKWEVRTHVAGVKENLCGPFFSSVL